MPARVSVSTLSTTCYRIDTCLTAPLPVFLIYVVGQCAGAFFAGPASERFGRRTGMVIGCSIILVGAAVITAAQNRAMFLGGRFFLGFGISISTAAAPTLAVELAPPQWRGIIVGY